MPGKPSVQMDKVLVYLVGLGLSTKTRIPKLYFTIAPKITTVISSITSITVISIEHMILIIGSWLYYYASVQISLSHASLSKVV